VVVSGAPGSAKTTVARALADCLGVPMLSKDVIKDTLFDALGTGDVAWSKRLGVAAMEVLFRLASELNQGVVEAFWRQPMASDRLRGVSSQIVEVNCRCPTELMKLRFSRRVHEGARHPGHLDSERKDDAALWADEAAGPLNLGGPVATFDTSEVLDIAAVVDFVRHSLI
jgi:predicted kinase